MHTVQKYGSEVAACDHIYPVIGSPEHMFDAVAPFAEFFSHSRVASFCARCPEAAFSRSGNGASRKRLFRRGTVSAMKADVPR